MDITEIIKLADALFFAQTGEHLDYLQEAILKGSLKGKTYTEIAEETFVSEGHLRELGSQLWKTLSDGLGKNINKTNLRGILKDSNNYQQIQSSITINNVNIYPKQTQSSLNTQGQKTSSSEVKLFLNNAPEISNFYGREPEISTLHNYLFNHHSRLITILGCNGLGKTTLILYFIKQIQNNFDYIIYQSLYFAPSLETTLTNLLNLFDSNATNYPNIDTKLSQLLEFLRQYKCLIILDDVQMLFSSGKLAGEYQDNYENYAIFWQKIASSIHRSCLILNTWEKPREIAKLETDNNWVNCLYLDSLGLANKEFLLTQNLSDEDNWENLINNYQGNPLWLKLTVTMIKELCLGKVGEFLQYGNVILSPDLQSKLNQQFNRLTEYEKTIMILLGNEDQPLNMNEILSKISCSSIHLLGVMQSLGRRLLIEITERDKMTLFSVNAVWKEYVKLIM